MRLNSLRPGQTAFVTELLSRDLARLDRLSAYGLMPGCTVTLLQHSPVVIFRVAETEISVDADIAREILVQET